VVGIFTQGTANDRHWWYWEDFYYELNRRHPVTQLLYRNYKDAALFAANPLGQGVYNNLQNNTEAAGFDYVGCESCYFDERPDIAP